MSNNLVKTTVAASQNQKEVTINDADGVLDAAMTEDLAVAITSSNARTLNTTEFTQNFFFIVDEDGGDPADAAITLTVPAVKRGTFQVLNNTAFDVTVEINSQPVTAPVIATGEVAQLTCDGTNVRQPASAGGGAFVDLSDTPANFSSAAGMVPVVNSGETALVFRARAYDFGMAFGTEPAGSSIIQRVQVSRAITIPADMAGSTGTVDTNPGSTYDIDLQDDGVSIGTISISTGGAFTFTTVSGTLKAVAAGSVLTFVAPSADGTIEGVAVGIVASENAT